MYYQCLALLKAQVSLSFGILSVKIKKATVCIMHSYMCWLLHQYTANTAGLISPNMYECFMKTKCLFTCLKRYGTNLSLKQG